MSGLPDVALGDEPVAHYRVARDPDPQSLEPDDPNEAEAGESGGELVVADLPDVKISGEPAPWHERAWLVLEHAARQAAGTVQNTAAAPGGIAHLRPESWAAYRARVASRSWLPDGHNGGWLERVPLVYHFTLGPLGFAVGHAIVLVTSRMSWLVTALLLVVAVLVLRAVTN